MREEVQQPEKGEEEEEEEEAMAIDGFVDWKGNQITSKKHHGGPRAASFFCVQIGLASLASIPNFLNLVTYLRGIMHEDVASSSITVANMVGATAAFSLFGAFISDSYISRYATILIFGPLEILGYGLLALQAHLPSLRPPQCDVGGQASGCERARGWNLAVLYIGLYTLALGEGCIRACGPALGGDQFDDDDPAEVLQKTSYFNWIAFAISFGGFVGLILLVWIEDNKGWDIGFGVCVLAILTAVLAVAGSLPFYRNQVPRGSPLTRMLQVFVAALRKRNLSLPASPEELYQTVNKNTTEIEVLPPTAGFKFLDKAAILDGEIEEDHSPWSMCSVMQVEETKAILKMAPIFFSSVLGLIPNVLVFTFTVQQGNTMNTNLGRLRVSPATLFVIPTMFQMVMLVVYDRFIVPFLRRMTGYVGGVTQLQRVGVGFLFTAMSTCAAALVERRRLRVVEANGLQDAGAGAVPMSVFWLVGQFFCLGVVDVTSFVGLLEFFNGEIPGGMKSIGTAIFWCVQGLASFMGTVTADLANAASRGGGGGGGAGWVEGNSLNRGHLDRFYWLLCVMQLLAFFNFVFWARRYVYRQNLRIQEGKKKKIDPQAAQEMAVID